MESLQVFRLTTSPPCGHLTALREDAMVSRSMRSCFGFTVEAFGRGEAPGLAVTVLTPSAPRICSRAFIVAIGVAQSYCWESPKRISFSNADAASVRRPFRGFPDCGDVT